MSVIRSACLAVSFCLTIVALDAYAQSPVPVKEHFDKIHAVRVDPYQSYADPFITGNLLSWVLAAYMRMYQATGDKAYLIKFVNQCVRIQAGRQDALHPGNSAYPPKWTLESDLACGEGDGAIECTYFNSLLLYPMSEFVYMVLADDDLRLQALPDTAICADRSDRHGPSCADAAAYRSTFLWRLRQMASISRGADAVVHEPGVLGAQSWYPAFER